MDVDETMLPVVQAACLQTTPPGADWLIEDLWTRQAVGVIGGSPKSCKSWFGLDLALSVASNTPCLGRFNVQQPGPSLIYLAEDSLPHVRGRLTALCHSRQLNLAEVDLHVITKPSLRLDLDADQKRLRATVARFKPALLLLDPLVRLHRQDENSAADISALLGYLRDLQRTYGVAIALVHHMTKKRRAELGQALRGSGDIHAWADSSAYLLRHKDALRLTLEHRAAAAHVPIDLRLVEEHGAIQLQLLDAASDANPGATPTLPLAERVRRLLTQSSAALTRTDLRNALRVNNHKLGDVLTDLQAQGIIHRRADGWILAPISPQEHHPAEGLTNQLGESEP